MVIKLQKTYHVHINSKQHADHLGIIHECGFKGNNNGHIYNVQRIHRYIDNESPTESGITDFGTCSRIKLWFHLRWLNLRGYKKDERSW